MRSGILAKFRSWVRGDETAFLGGEEEALEWKGGGAGVEGRRCRSGRAEVPEWTEGLVGRVRRCVDGERGQWDGEDASL